jgi:ketosteroid isomerase-like protein
VHLKLHLGNILGSSRVRLSLCEGVKNGMETKSAGQVALDMYTALAGGDLVRYLDCLSDDVRITLYGDHRLSRTFVGKDDILMNMFAPAVERLEGGVDVTFKHVIADGNRVAIEAEGKGRSRDGRAYDNFYCFVVTVEGGKVIESHEYMDTQLAKAIIG